MSFSLVNVFALAHQSQCDKVEKIAFLYYFFRFFNSYKKFQALSFSLFIIRHFFLAASSSIETYIFKLTKLHKVVSIFALSLLANR